MQIFILLNIYKRTTCTHEGKVMLPVVPLKVITVREDKRGSYLSVKHATHVLEQHPTITDRVYIKC